MLDFQVVDHPAIWPQKCMVCTGGKGSMLDTHTETLDGRIYICKSCVKRASEKFGFAKGEELDKLMDAATEMEQMQAGMEKKDKTIAKYKESLLEATNHINQLNAELERQRGEAEQLRHYAKQFKSLAQEVGMVGV